MKICFLMPNPFTLGGEQRVVSVLSNMLITKGHDITILTTDKNLKEDYNAYDLNKKVKILRLNSEPNFTWRLYTKVLRTLNKKTGIFKNNVKLLEILFCSPRLKLNLINNCNENKYDIIIGVAGYFSLILGMIKDKISSKTIGWQHNCFEVYFKKKWRGFWKQEKLVEKYMTKLDGYVVLTNNDKILMKKEFNMDVKTIYNPKSFCSSEKSNLNTKTFIAAGRVEYVKGFDMLIDAFADFSRKNSDWNLIIVGEGSKKTELQNKVEDLKLSHRIKFESYTNDMINCYKKASCLLLTSRWEGFGLVVTEAFEM